MITIETGVTPTSGDILRGTPSVGADREVYARQVEPRPSRFADGGAPYAAWAERTARAHLSARSGVLVRRHPGN